MNLPVTTPHQWLLLFHVLASMIWIGGVAAFSALATLVLRRGEREGIAWLLGSLRVIGPLVFAPSMLATIGFGVWMVLEGSYGFNQPWIWIALVLFAIAFIIGAVFQSRAAILGERALTAGDFTVATNQLIRWSWGMRLILLLLIAITWDMVIRP